MKKLRVALLIVVLVFCARGMAYLLDEAFEDVEQGVVYYEYGAARNIPEGSQSASDASLFNIADILNITHKEGMSLPNVQKEDIDDAAMTIHGFSENTKETK